MAESGRGLGLLLFLLNLLLVISATDPIEKRLGTKTPYRFVENENTDPITYPGCSPSKIWMLIRHGTRLPNEDLINFMRTSLPSIRDEILASYKLSKGPLSDDQILQFQNWIPIIASKRDKKILTAEGEDEMLRLAKRMKLRFNATIPTTYENGTFEFKYTPTERTKSSAIFFAKGLFEDGADNVNYIMTRKDDPVLRFYKNCYNWKQNVKKNPKTYSELQAYTRSSDMLNVLTNITNILKINVESTYTIARLFYMTCAFETAWTKNYDSPWCLPFSNSDMQIMEYAEDLKYYWVNGYGYKLTEELGCTVIKNVIDYFGESEPRKAAFHFTHSGTLLMTMAHLGIYKDKTPLSHVVRNDDRKWKTSLIDSFGTNLGFVLYKCGDEDKILLLQQERPVHFPECPDDYLCPLTTILTARGDAIKSCDLTKMCTLGYRDEL